MMPDHVILRPLTLFYALFFPVKRPVQIHCYSADSQAEKQRKTSVPHIGKNIQ